MYKVILVDDEILIREAISENIRWEELGYVFAGAYANGKEAIQAIEEQVPDLVLTDIYMPHVDGLALSKYIFENHPQIKIVILSGYDRFDYAKQAVHYQVFEYILKPVTAKELGQTLTRVRKKLDYEREQEENLSRIRGEYIKSLPVLKGRFLSSLLSGECDWQNVFQRLAEFQIHFNGKYHAAAIIEAGNVAAFLKRQEDTKDLALFAVYNISDEITRNHQAGIAFQNTDNRTVIIFSQDVKNEMEEQALLVCEEIKWAVSHFLHIELTISIGETVSALQKLQQSYRGSLSLLDYQYLWGDGKILRMKDLVKSETGERFIEAAPWINQLILAIKLNNQEEIRQVLNRFSQEIRDKLIPRQRSTIYIQNVILSVMHFVDNAGIDIGPFLEAEKNLYTAVCEGDQLEDIILALVSFCELIACQMNDQRCDHTKKQAVMALDYIEKNYSDPEVSLQSVCSYLAISPSYFSSVFKQCTGETFVEALTKKRIEKACQLLENTTLKTYEIASEVGYSDPHYFSSTFKKMAGKTPTQYARERSGQ